MSGKYLLKVIAVTVVAAVMMQNTASSAENAVKQIAGKVTQEVENSLSEIEAKKIAIDAYVYFYPLVTMEFTRRVMTNVTAPAGSKAPMGQFARLRSYPAVDDHSVTAPNADTLYTLAWFDVSKEPWVISTPDMNDRYYLLPMLDAWTNVFAVPGKRTTGTGAQTFAITGPNWKGSLPPGVKEYKSSTGIVWLLGRIYCTGTPEDYQAVHALQDQIKAVPLSAFGKPYAAPAGVIDTNIDMKTAVRDQVNALDAAAYFKIAAELMRDNPSLPEDANMLAKLNKIGITPGQPFDITKLNSDVAKGITVAVKPAQKKIMEWMKEGILAGDMSLKDGWLFTTKTGLYGTNYRQRALITAIGLGANRPQDAIYPTSEGPDVLAKYDGANKYVMHFNKGEMPPVEGFWSLTMYDANYFFVPNVLNRYTVSQRTHFNVNADGSVDIYIQHQSPGKDKEQNWLPAPKDKFILMLRLYWPKETPPSLLDGTWKIPAVKRCQKSLC